MRRAFSSQWFIHSLPPLRPQMKAIRSDRFPEIVGRQFEVFSEQETEKWAQLMSSRYRFIVSGGGTVFSFSLFLSSSLSIPHVCVRASLCVFVYVSVLLALALPHLAIASLSRRGARRWAPRSSASTTRRRRPST